jgi:hypothetical protein
MTSNRDIPPNPTVLPSADSQEATPNRKTSFRDQLTDLEPWGKAIEAICAILLVVITATYTHFASQQATYSQTSSEAAKSAADTATTTLALAERAWIGARLENSVYELGKPLIAVVAFENLGKTPALNVKTCQIAKLVTPANNIDVNCPDDALSPGFDVVQPTAKDERLGNAVGFNNEPHLNLDGLLTKPVADTLLTGNKVALTYGYVKYDDIFGGHHWTKYCYQLKVLIGSPGMPETHIWSNCEVGNDVDKNYSPSVSPK